MSFEHKQFKDGDSTFKLPVWKHIIDEIHDDLDAFDYAEEREKRERYQQDEIGLKHPKTGSFIRLKDDGTIESFTQNGTGWRAKPNGTIQLFGDRLQLIGHETHIASSPNASRAGDTPLAGTYPSILHKGLTPEAITLIEGGQD